MWSRTTELLKRNTFQGYNKRVSCKEIAYEHRIGGQRGAVLPPDDAAQKQPLGKPLVPANSEG